MEKYLVGQMLIEIPSTYACCKECPCMQDRDPGDCFFGAAVTP